MCLIQAEIERQGVVTVSLTMLPEITRKIRPLRTLTVPYPLGYPLGEPDNPGLQKDLIRAMLKACEVSDVPFLGGICSPGMTRIAAISEICRRLFDDVEGAGGLGHKHA